MRGPRASSFWYCRRLGRPEVEDEDLFGRSREREREVDLSRPAHQDQPLLARWTLPAASRITWTPVCSGASIPMSSRR